MKQSDPKAELQLHETIQKTISPSSPASPTSTGSGSLKRHLLRKSPVPLSEYITVAKLASELEVEVERLAPLIAHGYLRIMDAGKSLAETVVARPPAAAMDWLRTMFMPLELRPLITAKEITALFGITDDELRYICLTDGIPLYDDPAFGSLLSVAGFWSLSKGLISMRSPLRTDRQMLLLILGRIKNVKDLGRIKPLTYSERIEKEISRIAHMEEPERTMRATDFWKAFSEADTITDCLERREGSEISGKDEKLLARMQSMKNRLEGRSRSGEEEATAPESEPGESSGAS